MKPDRVNKSICDKCKEICKATHSRNSCYLFKYKPDRVDEIFERVYQAGYCRGLGTIERRTDKDKAKAQTKQALNELAIEAIKSGEGKCYPFASDDYCDGYDTGFNEAKQEDRQAIEKLFGETQNKQEG